MKWISFLFLASTLFVSSAFSVYKPRIQNGRVIYGPDNRQDVYLVQDAALRNVARSTAAVFMRYYLKKVDTVYQVLAGTYGKTYRLCSDEAFYDQPAGAMCSAFLVGPDLVATAGHCISPSNCSSKTFVFDYAVNPDGSYPTTVPEENVYSCKSVIYSEVTQEQDYAVVRLDRVVTNREPLKLSTRDVQPGDALTVIGHPAGLPTKVADGAQVLNSKDAYFVADLDTYGGNSGSPVFNSHTLEVEGILVRGEADFQYDSELKCNKSNRCTAETCSGEDVTKIGFVNQVLNTTYLE